MAGSRNGSTYGDLLMAAGETPGETPSLLEEAAKEDAAEDGRIVLAATIWRDQRDDNCTRFIALLRFADERCDDTSEGAVHQLLECSLGAFAIGDVCRRWDFAA